jgi:hypothetical protein
MAGDAGFEPPPVVSLSNQKTFGSGVQKRIFEMLVNVLNYSRLDYFEALTVLDYLGVFWILSGTYAAR